MATQCEQEEMREHEHVAKWMDGLMDGWMDGWMDVELKSIHQREAFIRCLYQRSGMYACIYSYVTCV